MALTSLLPVPGLRARHGQLIAALLGIVFGAVGLHRFYLGFWGFGIAQIAVTFITGGFGVMWGFIEGVLIFTGHIYKDAKGRHLK